MKGIKQQSVKGLTKVPKKVQFSIDKPLRTPFSANQLTVLSDQPLTGSLEEKLALSHRDLQINKLFKNKTHMEIQM
jgi:hypothetical protein